MQLLYILLVIISFLLILNRKFDFLSIALISQIIYTINLLVGIAWIPRTANSYYYFEQISSNLYIIIFTQLIITIIFTAWSDQKSEPSINEGKYNFSYSNKISTNLSMLVLTSAALLAVLMNLLSIGADIFTLHKSLISQRLNITYSLAIWTALVGWTYSLDNNRKTIKFLSSLIIFISLFLGSRAYFATALVIYILYKWNKLKVKYSSTFRVNIRILTLGAASFLFIMAYKEIYQDVLALNFDLVIQKVFEPKTYTDAIFNQEPSIVLSLFNYILENEFKYNGLDTIARIGSIIPFFNNVIPTTVNIRFSAIAMNTIFNSTYGLASSFWGEIYAMFGVIGIPIVTYIWVKVLNFADNIKNHSSYFLVPAAAYFSFYIHRLDYIQVIAVFKNLVLPE